METYTFLRALADSWGMLAMFLFFIGIIVWVFRPGAKASQDDAARMIFRNETKPKDDTHGN